MYICTVEHDRTSDTTTMFAHMSADPGAIHTTKLVGCSVPLGASAKTQAKLTGLDSHSVCWLMYCLPQRMLSAWSSPLSSMLIT